MAPSRSRTVADIDSFITMLRAACDSQLVYDRLEALLSLPSAKRQSAINSLVTDQLVEQAPRPLVMANACLLDDEVADKAYAAIDKCRRGGFF